MAATLKSARGATQKKCHDLGLEPWPQGMVLGDGEASLGCDSLELLWLSAAVNEMFHLHEACLDSELLRLHSFGDWLDVIEAAWQSGVNSITFSTSGSTGKPKFCAHSFQSLAVEVAHLSDLFASTKRIISYVPPHHLYGFLFTAMLPEIIEAPVIAGFHSGFVAAKEVRWGDLVIAVPETWQWLSQSVRSWPDGVGGVTSGGPCGRDLISLLNESGLSEMTEIYGSSENAGVGTRRWPEPMYTLMPHWTRASSASLLRASGCQADLMDELRWSDDRTFDVVGRLDGAVQVGGTNVHPARIASMLQQLKGVNRVTVELVPGAFGGYLQASILLDPDATEDDVQREIEACTRQQLGPLERPKRVTFSRLSTNRENKRH